MKRISVLAVGTVASCLSVATAFALDPGPVVVTPVITTDVTADGKPILLPQKDAQVVASIFDIPPGASVPVHKHPFPRYGYVLAGTLQVTKAETGEKFTYKTGDFIVEMIGEWHQGANTGTEPVKLLVIDQVEKGAKNTIIRE